MGSTSGCIFCKIVDRELDSPIVFEDESTLAFLDHRPLFPGHTLVIPRNHVETLADLATTEIPAFFGNVQMLARVVESAMAAEGSFVAMNNRVSQSVLHLHVHVVPRRRKDGLKGFFWPRTKYRDQAHLEEVRDQIRSEISQRKNKTHKNLI